MAQFRIDPATIEYEETHRGVNATAKILDDDDVVVGSIEDKAESIVAPVRFDSEAVRAAFIAAAREAQTSEKHGEAMMVSEYARQLLVEAEDVLQKSSGPRP